MSLAEAVMLALRHSRAVERAYLDRLVQRFDLKIAQDKFLPDAYLFSSTSQENMGGESAHRTEVGGKAVLKVPTGGEFGLTWSQPVYTSQTEQWFDNFGNGIALVFTQPLLKGGGIQVGRADQVLAEYKEKSNLLGLQYTLMDTITQVVYAYRRFLLAQRGLEISRLSLERSKDLLEKNRVLIEEGRKAKVELIETEANVASQELGFMVSQNSVDTARLDLLKILDIDRHLLIEPTESIEVEPVQMKEETLLDIALKNNQDYQKALIAVKVAQTNLLLAENKQRWQLDLEAQYNMTNSSGYTGDASEGESDGAGDYLVAMKLEIPFGDDSIKRDLLSAQVACRKAEIDLKELKEDVAISVQDMFRDIGMKWKQVELSQRARDLAQKQLDVELEKFKNDKSDNFQVVSYQNSLIVSENAENRSKIDYLNTLTALDMYLGTTLEHWGVDPATARKVELP
ncbi:MAG: TolC family protein [Candidatus Electrothrix aestuarii]|uniref:TolC family protein n=1 Tax=Candidatus Electrothrix aestuarii TaxID=3062594 RepID=A0AAU8M122_9BACT|nr:TolC family protein [Candidatus Electrothrix aestuarii]WPD24040.1 MAG: TolC family protein [Candidatus Electrothrix sp. GW3-3]